MRRTRTELLRLLEPGLGQEAADALLEEIETVDPDRLATKEDLAAFEAALRSDLRNEIGSVRTDLGQEIETVRSDLGHRIDLLRTEMDGRFGQVDERFERVEERFRHVDERLDGVHDALSGEIAGAKNEVLAAVRGEMVAAITTQTRSMQYTLAGTVISIFVLALTFSTFL